MCIGGTGKTREYENETRKNRLVRQQMFGLKEVSAWATETAEILPPYILYRWRRRQWNKTNTDTRIQKKHTHKDRSTWKLLINWQPFLCLAFCGFRKNSIFSICRIEMRAGSRFRSRSPSRSFRIISFCSRLSSLFCWLIAFMTKICISLVENVKWVLSSGVESVQYIESSKTLS